MKREIHLRELQLLDAVRRRFMHHQQTLKETELQRLDDEIERKVGLSVYNSVWCSIVIHGILVFLAKRRTRAYWYVKETIHFPTSYQQQVGFYRFSALVLAPHVNHFFNWHEPQPSVITACCRPKFDSFPSVSNITFLSRVAERIRT